MRSPQYIPSFYFYKFANAVAAPYTSLDAYRSGAIDEDGNIIATEGSIDDFEYFVIKLKKIFEDLPPGITKSRLTNVVGLFQLFAEEVECIGVTQEQVIALTEAHVILNSNNELSFIELLEDMGTAGMSTGSAPGELGTPAEAPEANKGNVSGYDPKLGEILTRNAPVNMFAGIEMFNVSPEEFKQFKQSKAWRNLPDSPTKRYLQRFQRRNKEGKMAVRDETSGDVFFIPYKEKSFMEEFGLEGLSILNEDDNALVTDILNKTKDEDPTTKNLKTALDLAYERAQKGRTEEAAQTAARAVKKKNIDPESVDPESLTLGAEASETAGGFTDLVASMPHLKKLMKTSAGARFAANFLGGYLYTANRENSNDPTKLDSMRLVDRDDPMWGLVGSNKIELPDTEIGIVGVNQRNTRGTGPVLMSPEKIIELPGAPAEDIEEYSRILRTGEGDPTAKDRIERFMQGQEGLGLRTRTLVGAIQDKNLPVQVMYQGTKGGRPTTSVPFIASPEAQISSVMGRSGRFRLGRTGKTPQYQAQQPEARFLRNQPGTFSPIYGGNRELISALRNMGLDPSKQLERLTSVLSGRVGSNYRDIMREILSRED